MAPSDIIIIISAGRKKLVVVFFVVRRRDAKACEGGGGGDGTNANAAVATTEEAARTMLAVRAAFENLILFWIFVDAMIDAAARKIIMNVKRWMEGDRFP